jgi:putative heme-binding domain-containing protein
MPCQLQTARSALESSSDSTVEESAGPRERFRVGREFEVQLVLDAEVSGSLNAMAFNEFGHLVVGREGGPLLLIYDSDDDGIIDESRVYCDQVSDVQGILPLNGDIYVTGDGPEGNGCYKLSDQDRDGSLETTKLLFGIESESGEPGGRGLTLGPDGWIYVVLSPHARPTLEPDSTGPYRDYYDGALLGSEDANTSSWPERTPIFGGSVLRTDVDGKAVQLFCGGLSQTQDLAFNSQGDLFAHDGGRDRDEGAPWYRPARLYQVVPSAEFGWRPGWTQWPEYFVDTLPALADTGKGLPTGAVFYEHFAFPRRYQDRLFLADWSRNRILAAQFQLDGASHKVSAEVFLEGHALNITDLDVGPDGWLYFVTGGKDTAGGLYRVTWKGKVPSGFFDLGTGISPAIRQPQLQSAWARQEIARVKSTVGDDWGPMLLGVVRSTANPTNYRIRALDLMQLYGPHPASALLVELARDKNEVIRRKAASLMGVFADKQTQQQLVRLLEDSDRMVRRKACESLVAAGQPAPIDDLIPMLASDDRFEAWAARRLLETLPPDEWRDRLLSSTNHRVFVQGAMALMVASPTQANALKVLGRAEKLMNGFVSDRDFISMLRVLQVTILRGRLLPQQLTGLRNQLATEFPAGDVAMNRELIRLLTYLQAGSILDRYFDYFQAEDTPPAEKVHLALHLQYLETGWSSEQKMQLFEFFSEAAKGEEGSPYRVYLSRAAQQFAQHLTPAESIEVLRRGKQWPAAALGALYKLPPQLDDDLRTVIEQLDRDIDGNSDAAFKRLMVGIVAVLARSGDAASMAYLREVWQRSPSRREPIVMGLAQDPQGENWPYLVQSLPIVNGGTAMEVLRRLSTVDQVPEDPEHFRQALLAGLRGSEPVAVQAIKLLEHWSGMSQGVPADEYQQELAAWQSWFANAFPEYPPAELPVDSDDSRWKYQQLLGLIDKEDAVSASADRGAVVFERASCVDCHRVGERGGTVGPDLSNIGQRYTSTEILQSVLYPSHLIAQKYAAKTLRLTDGREVTGIVSSGPDGEKLVRQSDGGQLTVREEEIDDSRPSRTSVMGENLLNPLTLQEIVDLFSYLRGASPAAVASRTEEASEDHTSHE